MSTARTPQQFGGAGYLLGFAAGGFFDGVLLHQILQWHHLLSGLGGDMRFQVLADGYFHAAMYLVAAAGLWRLMRAPRGSSRTLAAQMLIGFGGWHITDAVLSHWILQIHRISMDASIPLAWDLGWLVLFGLAPLLAGLWLKGRGGSGGAGTSIPAATAGVAMALLGLQAAQPVSRTDEIATIVFAPTVSTSEMFAAVAEADGRVVWADGDAGLIAASVAPQNRYGLYRRGALMVTGAGWPPGCLDALRPA